MHALHVRPPTVPPPRRFALRTLVLMVLTLVVCLHFYWRTHATPPARARLLPPDVRLQPAEKP